MTGGCGNDAEEPEVAEIPTAETVDLNEGPTVSITPTPVTASPTAVPTATPRPLPGLLVWPTTAPPEWPRTPDEAAMAFAQHVARGERAAEPRPAVQQGTTATAELPRLAEDGTPFGLASVIHLEAVELEDDTTAWVVLSARSPDIVIDAPAVGELLAGDTAVVGEGQGFEGTIVLQIEDQDGLLGSAIAGGGSLGENKPFETHLPFDERSATGDWAILTGYGTSPVDGSISALTMLPMRLADGS